MPLLRIGALASASGVEGSVHPSERPRSDLRHTDIYVAAPLATRKEAYAVGLALKLARPSIRLVSSWLDRCTDGRASDPEEQGERELVLWDNIHEIEQADIVVALTGEDTPKSTIGDIVWALAIGTPVVWVTRGAQGRSIWDGHWGVTRVEAVDPLRSILEIATVLDEVIAARPRRRRTRRRHVAREAPSKTADDGNGVDGKRSSLIVDAEALSLAQQEVDALALALTEALDAYPDTREALQEWACALAMPAPPMRTLIAARSALRVAESRYTATHELGRACRSACKRLREAQQHLDVLERLGPRGLSS